MMWDPAIAAAERTEAARHLFAQARTDAVDLVTLSALELCALGLHRQPLFEESVARAWMQMGDRRRRQVMDEVTDGLIRRGLLINDNPQPGSGKRDGTYALQPRLGLMLAARCRPTFIVVAAGEGQGLRPLNLFALGDVAEPVRGIVAEVPAALPPGHAADHPKARKLGPLGWIYRYVLVSPAKAAEILARWTIAPPAQPGKADHVRYLVSAYRPDREQPAGYRLGVRGDGQRAVVDGLGSGELAGAAYDLEGLSGIMLRLLTEASP